MNVISGDAKGLLNCRSSKGKLSKHANIKFNATIDDDNRISRKNRILHRFNGSMLCERQNGSNIMRITTMILCFGAFNFFFQSQFTLQNYLGEETGFHPHWHPLERSERFPTVDDRIRLYMTNWYLPPCQDENLIDDHIYFTHDSLEHAYSITKFNDGKRIFNYTSPLTITADTVLILGKEKINQCSKYSLLRKKGVRKKSALRDYCSDAVKVFDYIDSATPFVVKFGDSVGSTLDRNGLPMFNKFRPRVEWKNIEEDILKDRNCSIARSPALADGTYLPIIWKLNTKRHYNPIKKILRYDIRWEKKIDKAFWRGGLTNGSPFRNLDRSNYDNCLLVPRCNLVLKYQDSLLVDAGVTKFYKDHPNSVNGTNLLKETAHYKKMLTYKALISIEGNDVSTSLKWMLFSRSVVLMPQPTKTSYAMEELLKPWVHFIPINSNLTNLEERVQWIKHNDKEAQKIAERGTIFMHDLLFHGSSSVDNKLIELGIIERYKSFFVQAT